ncbi:MAG: hypothetical protein CSA62_08295 [Planctomycetota bacterium]|nr:MAG: hypothetical protein CSA62_08295 [Planctomycetota bacterium]
MTAAPLTSFGWACRQLGREPGTHVLMGLALFALVLVCGTVLLLAEAWTATARRLILSGPTHVVRRVDAGGWRAIEVESGLKAARSVLGVTKARARVWGRVTAGEQVLTLIGLGEDRREFPHRVAPGQAILGPGVEGGDQASILLRGAQGEARFRVQQRLGEEWGLSLHDVVLVPEAAARRVLGIPAGYASDLCLSVFHEGEEEAVAAELAGAFDFAVRVTTAKEAIGALGVSFSRLGSLRMLLLVPAMLALSLLMLVQLRRGRAARRDLGLYKALGWSTGELVRLQLLSALLVALPALLLGLSASFALVHWPGIRWPAEWLLAWPGSAPALYLAPGSVLIVAFGVAGFVLVPWLLATLLPVLRSSAVDPSELLGAGS